jgi:hypothetical protein
MIKMKTPPISKITYKFAVMRVAEGKEWETMLRRSLPFTMFKRPWTIQGWCYACKRYQNLPFTCKDYANPRCPQHPDEVLDLTAPVAGVFAMRRGKEVKVGMTGIEVRSIIEGTPLNVAKAYLDNLIVANHNWTR